MTRPQQLTFEQETRGPTEIAPGAWWVPGWLDEAAQRELATAFAEWAAPPAGLRRPRMPNGAPFSTRAVCLGWHWYPYRYSRTCDDHDGAPVKPFPPRLARLGAAACTATGFAPAAFDAAIVNLYEPGAKLGLHQDKIEGAEVIAAGSPVVTISLGDTCVFRFGNSDRPSRPYRDVPLASGDLFVFGGPSRMAFHGVPKVHGGTANPDLGLDGRVSITLREIGSSWAGGGPSPGRPGRRRPAARPEPARLRSLGFDGPRTRGRPNPGPPEPQAEKERDMADLEMSDADRDAFLSAVRVGVLAIARRDKGPLAVPIWYRYEDGVIVLLMSRTSLKATLLRAAGRATLTAQRETPPYAYVSAEGPVTFSDEVPDVLAVATRYLGPDLGRAYAADNPATAASVIVRLTPERWNTADFDRAG